MNLNFQLILWFILLGLSPQVCSDSKNSEPDPWQGFNRSVFAFNEAADQYLLRPVAVGYNWLLPTPLNNGLSNAFANTFEVNTMLNSGLQAKPKNLSLSFARFAINSTLGFFGLFDVASELGIYADEEDFGQTFAVWGVDAGPYLVLPLFGPSTVRDAAGLIPNLYVNPLVNLNNDSLVNYGRIGLYFIDSRADVIAAETLITGDKYIFLRDAFLQNRDFLISDGLIEDSFGDDLDDDNWLDDEF